MTHLRAAGLLFVAALAAPAPLAAQALGLPVRNAGLPRGLSVAADLGVPNDASGLGTSYGVTAGLTLGLVGVTATVARAEIEGADTQGSMAATANLRLLGGPLVPFFAILQGGIGSYTSGTSIEGADIVTRTYPVGLGLGWTIASPVVSLKPWLAPRVQWSSTSAGAYSDPHELDPAVSGGIDLGFINGLAVRAMYDRVLQDDGPDASVWSLGLGYSFRIGR